MIMLLVLAAGIVATAQKLPVTCQLKSMYPGRCVKTDTCAYKCALSYNILSPTVTSNYVYVPGAGSCSCCIGQDCTLTKVGTANSESECFSKYPEQCPCDTSTDRTGCCVFAAGAKCSCEAGTIKADKYSIAFSATNTAVSNKDLTQISSGDSFTLTTTPTSTPSTVTVTDDCVGLYLCTTDDTSSPPLWSKIIIMIVVWLLTIACCSMIIVFVKRRCTGTSTGEIAGNTVQDHSTTQVLLEAGATRSSSWNISGASSGAGSGNGNGDGGSSSININTDGSTENDMASMEMERERGFVAPSSVSRESRIPEEKIEVVVKITTWFDQHKIEFDDKVLQIMNELGVTNEGKLLDIHDSDVDKICNCLKKTAASKFRAAVEEINMSLID